jgi:putative alpha-1,2-mannosidase
VARNSSRSNRYVQSATLNGTKLDKFWFRSSELLKGGSLILENGGQAELQLGDKRLPRKILEFNINQVAFGQ